MLNRKTNLSAPTLARVAISAVLLAIASRCSARNVVDATSRLRPAEAPASFDVAKKHKHPAFGIFIDAGSGSTKTTVWTWNACYKHLPPIEIVKKLDRLPALASFATSQGGDPLQAGPMLLPALEQAKKEVPEDQWPHTPVYLTATAGMRLIPEDDRARILRRVNVWLADSSNHPFLYGTKPPFTDGQFWAQTISGDDEGAFGFLDVNYLLGKLLGQDESVDLKGSDPSVVLGKASDGAVGWVDTGGASLQVSFAPQQSSLLGNVYPVSPLSFVHITNSTGSRYASTIIYTHSWNGLGQREARKRMQRGIAGRVELGDKSREDRYQGGSVFSDPCLLKGEKQVMEMPNTKGKPGMRNYTFVGSGDFYMCLWFVDDLVLNLREECLLGPCGAAGVYVPEPGSIQFYGFRKMLNLARPLGLASKKGSWAPSDYSEIGELVQKVCSMTAEEVKDAGIEDDWETDSGPCFQGVLMLRFLEVMGSPKIVFADRMDKDSDKKFNYARGAMLSFIINQDRDPSGPPEGWPKCPNDSHNIASV